MKLYLPVIISQLISIFLSTQIKAQENNNKKYFQPIQDVFQTELVYPQEKNEIQITTLPSFYKYNTYNHFQIPLSLEYGITDFWQLEFEWNSFQNINPVSEPSVKGIGDLQIGMKYSFMKIFDSNIHVAGGFEIGVPLGDEEKELGEGIWEYEPFIIMAADLPQLNHAQIFAQSGISFAKNEDQEISLSGGFFIPFNRIILSAEITSLNTEQQNQLYFTPGLIYKLPGKWEAGLATPVGLNNKSEKYGVTIMLTYEFNLIGDND